MPNHYHLLIKIEKETLSQQMHDLGVSYTKAINKRYNRTGSLFEGRFQAKLVERDEYLMHLSRYIHLNPVKAGLVSKAENWIFSSYQDFIGYRHGTLPNPQIVLEQFQSVIDYKHFVEDESLTSCDISILMVD